jgi:hypothetical protein
LFYLVDEGDDLSGSRLKKPWDHRFHQLKKPAGKPVKLAGSLGLKKFRHGLEVGTGPVRVPGRIGSTGNGSHRFCEP